MSTDYNSELEDGLGDKGKLITGSSYLFSESPDVHFQLKKIWDLRIPFIVPLLSFLSTIAMALDLSKVIWKE